MKKIFFSILSVIVLSMSAQAQNITKGVVFTTGGSFMAPSNYVKIYAMETDSFGSWVVDSVLGDFSNQVIVESHYAYVHVGRAGGNPAGMDRIYKYNLLADSSSLPIDSTVEISGIQKFEISENRIVITRGYPASSNFVEIVAKDSMQFSLYSDTIIGGSCTGVAIMNNKAYVAATNFGLNSGEVHVIDLGNTIMNTGSITLDTLSSGVAQIYAESGMIYLTSKRFRPDYSTWYAGVSILDLSDSTFTTDTTGMTSATGFDFYNSMILGDFGSPIETYNVTNSFKNTVLAGYATAAKKDPNGTSFAVQNTDYFSFGTLTIYDSLGSVLGAVSTDISGSALAIATNNVPTALNDSVYGGSVAPGTIFYTEPLLNDSDVDGDLLFLDAILNQPNNGTVVIVGDSIQFTANTAHIFDTVYYVVTDVWGDSDTAWVSYQLIGSVKQLDVLESRIFPNPATDILNISSEIGNIEAIQVLDLSGRLVKSIQNLNGNQTIDISDLNTGIYFVQVSVNGTVETKRLVVQ